MGRGGRAKRERVGRLGLLSDLGGREKRVSYEEAIQRQCRETPARHALDILIAESLRSWLR